MKNLEEKSEKEKSSDDGHTLRHGRYFRGEVGKKRGRPRLE